MSVIADDVISQHASIRPIDRVLERLPHAKLTPHGWYNTNCPVHGDRHPSFGFIETDTGGVAFNCFSSSACTHERILEAIGLTKEDVQGRGTRRKKTREIALWDLAVDKNIPPYVLSSFGITDGYIYTDKYRRKWKTIRIPLYLEDGKEHTLWRLRSALKATNGTISEGEGGLIPYGLDHLQEAREAGYLVIVEGESDCWTQWRFSLPALGVPGASNTKTLDASSMLTGIDRVYIIQEPDDAGSTFPKNVVKRLAETGYTGACYAVSLQATHEVKDPNALLHKLYKEQRINDYPAEMQRAIEAASPIKSADEKEPEATYEEIRSEVIDAITQRDLSAVYGMAEKIVVIEDTKEYALLVSLVRDKAHGWRAFQWSDFNKMLKEAKGKKEQAKQEASARFSAKPVICLNEQMGVVIDEALDAIQKHNLVINDDTKKHYTRSRSLARICADDSGAPVIDLLTDTMMLDHVVHVADFATYNEKTNKPKSVHPSKEIARILLDKGVWGWQFPVLTGITQTPVLRPDGSILDDPGYDEVTHLCYIPSPDMKKCKIPHHPTSEDLQKATELVRYVIQDFPFETEADHANMVGLMLTSLVRPAITGDTQLALIDGNLAGAGKGYLAQLISVIATGSLTAASVHVPVDRGRIQEEEFRKQLESELLEGTQMIILDNIACKLESSLLDKILTAPGGMHKARPLGTSKRVPVSTYITWVATGNNLEIGGDLARRCYRIRLISPTSKPEERTDFAIGDFPTWIQDNRADLIAALLTMARAWYNAGQPQAPNIPNLASFTNWARTVGGILHYAGIHGFLQNRAGLKAEVNQDNTQWTNFLTSWYEWQELYKTGWITPSTLAKKITNDRDIAVVQQENAVVCGGSESQTTATINLFEALPEDLKLQLANKPLSFAVNLGRALVKRVKTPFGASNIHIESHKNSHSGNNEYKVVAVVAVVDSDIQTRGEKIFFSHDNHDDEMKKNNFLYRGDTHAQPQQPQQTAKNMPPTPVQIGSASHSTICCGSESQTTANPPQTTASSVRTTANQYDDRIARLQQKFHSKGLEEKFWREITRQPDAWKNGRIPTSEWIGRLKQCLYSDDKFLVNNAVDVLESEGM